MKQELRGKSRLGVAGVTALRTKVIVRNRFCKPVSNSSGRMPQFVILYGLYNLSTARRKDSK